MVQSAKILPVLGATIALCLAAGCAQQAPPPMQAAAPECSHYEVHFASGSALMDAEDIRTINAVTLKAASPDARVILVGKTDTVGSKGANMALSKQRADNVNKALVDNGVIASHIAWFFTGEEKPVVATADQEDEPLNRVVKIAVGVNCPLPR